jgi:hypothetical protein
VLVDLAGVKGAFEALTQSEQDLLNKSGWWRDFEALTYGQPLFSRMAQKLYLRACSHLHVEVSFVPDLEPPSDFAEGSMPRRTDMELLHFSLKLANQALPEDQDEDDEDDEDSDTIEGEGEDVEVASPPATVAASQRQELLDRLALLHDGYQSAKRWTFIAAVALAVCVLGLGAFKLGSWSRPSVSQPRVAREEPHVTSQPRVAPLLPRFRARGAGNGVQLLLTEGQRVSDDTMRVGFVVTNTTDAAQRFRPVKIPTAPRVRVEVESLNGKPAQEQESDAGTYAVVPPHSVTTGTILLRDASELNDRDEVVLEGWDP